MATLTQVRAYIYQRFVDLWDVYDVPFTFDNEVFDGRQRDTSWVRLAVRNSASNQETLGFVGNRKFNRKGIIICQVFTPADRGLKRNDEISARVREIFEATSFNGIYTLATTVREVGTNGFEFQSNVETEFFYEQIK